MPPAFPIGRRRLKQTDEAVTSVECIENIVVVVAAWSSVILIHAVKVKDEEIEGIVDNREGSGKVRNCPVEMVTKLF